jgi:cation transport regulator ChaC
MPGLVSASASSFLNFAYGSNMLRARITARVPSARVVGPAVLRGHALRWHKVGRDRSGKCDVVRDAAPGAAVHGVLYEIATAEKAALDRAEGLGAGYEEQTVPVECQGRVVPAHLYVASAIDPSLAPYSWYRALVVAGARQHALPAAYVEALQAVAAIEDADAERHALHIALSMKDA